MVTLEKVVDGTVDDEDVEDLLLLVLDVLVADV